MLMPAIPIYSRKKQHDFVWWLVEYIQFLLDIKLCLMWIQVLWLPGNLHEKWTWIAQELKCKVECFFFIYFFFSSVNYCFNKKLQKALFFQTKLTKTKVKDHPVWIILCLHANQLLACSPYVKIKVQSKSLFWVPTNARFCTEPAGHRKKG